jgi:hypothetical protein
MFTWICPKCGREVPPQYSECPDCERAEQATAAAPGQPAPLPPQVAVPEYRPPEPVHSAPPPPAPPPVTQAPPPAWGQAYPAYAPPAPAPRAGLPTWLLTLVFALAIFGAVAGVYWLVGALKGGGAAPAAASAGPAAIPAAAPASNAPAKVSPFQKYIEVSGVRFLEDAKKKPQVRFVVTNHSGADITGLSGTVTIWARSQKSEEQAGSFTFTTSLGAWETKDLSALLTTKLEMIELPDWQNTRSEVQITGPQ